MIDEVFKGLVHPKMKISPYFTRPQSNLGVYDLPLSDESNRVILKNFPCSPKCLNGSSVSVQQSTSNKARASTIKPASRGSGG